MSQTQFNTLQRAVSGVSVWGRNAAIRYYAKRTGCNINTARRCVTIAMQCSAADRLI